MSTIAGKFKVVQAALSRQQVERLAQELGLSQRVKEKLAGGCLFVEKLPDQEYRVEIVQDGQLKGTYNDRPPHGDR